MITHDLESGEVSGSLIGEGEDKSQVPARIYLEGKSSEVNRSGRWRLQNMVRPERQFSRGALESSFRKQSICLSELTTQRLSSTISSQTDYLSTLNLFETTETLKVVVVRDLPRFWSVENILQALGRFGTVEDYDETVDGRNLPVLIVKFERPQSALHAVISLAARGVGFGSKKLNIQFARGEFQTHPILDGADTVECEAMRRDIEEILEPMFKWLTLIGIPNKKSQSLTQGSPLLFNMVFGYIYPLLVNIILLFSAVYLTVYEGIESYISGHPDFAILVITCGIFIFVCWGIHLHHCRVMTRPSYQIGIVPLIQYTVTNIEAFEFVAATIKSEISRLAPRTVFFAVISFTLFFKLCYEIRWTVGEQIALCIGSFYAVGMATTTFIRVRLYSRIVENGFREKMRDLLSGDVTVPHIKKQYILISLLTQEAISQEHPMLVWITSSLLFSAIFIAASMFIVVGVLEHVGEPMELMLGFSYNIVNELWWFATMYEGTRATDSFNDMLDNLRGPLYLAANRNLPEDASRKKHSDLDAYVPGIKVFGQVLDRKFLALAAKLNVSALAVVALRVFMAKFSS